MYLDALDHLAHDAVVVLRFVGAALGYDTLDFFQPRLPGTVLVDALLNRCDATVKLLDLIGDAFEFILAAFNVFSRRDGFIDQLQHPFVQRVDAARQQVDFLRTAIYADGFSNGGFHERQVCGLVLRVKAPQRSDNGPMQGFFLHANGALAVFRSIIQTADAAPDDFLPSVCGPCDASVAAAAFRTLQHLGQCVFGVFSGCGDGCLI